MENEFQQKLTDEKLQKLQWHLQEKCNYLSKKTFCAVVTSVDHALYWLCSAVCMCFTMCHQCPANSQGPTAELRHLLCIMACAGQWANSKNTILFIYLYSDPGCYFLAVI